MSTVLSAIRVVERITGVSWTAMRDAAAVQDRASDRVPNMGRQKDDAPPGPFRPYAVR